MADQHVRWLLNPRTAEKVCQVVSVQAKNEGVRMNETVILKPCRLLASGEWRSDEGALMREEDARVHTDVKFRDAVK